MSSEEELASLMDLMDFQKVAFSVVPWNSLSLNLKGHHVVKVGSLSGKSSLVLLE